MSVRSALVSVKRRADAIVEDCLSAWDRGHNGTWVPNHVQMAMVLPRIGPCLACLKEQAEIHRADYELQLMRGELLREKSKLLRAHPAHQPNLVESEKAASSSVLVLADIVDVSLGMRAPRSPGSSPYRATTLTRVKLGMGQACDEWARTLMEMDGCYVFDRNYAVDARLTRAYALDQNARFRGIVLLLQEQCLALTEGTDVPWIKHSRTLWEMLRRHIPPAQLPSPPPGTPPVGPQGQLVYRHFSLRHFAQVGLPPQLVYEHVCPGSRPAPPTMPTFSFSPTPQTGNSPLVAPTPLALPPSPPPSTPTPPPSLGPSPANGHPESPALYPEWISALEMRFGLPLGQGRAPNHRLSALEEFAQLTPPSLALLLRLRALSEWADQHGL